MKRLLSVLLTFALLCFYIPISYTNNGLSDIANHWASEVVNEWFNNDLISGYPDGTFKPDGTVSRAEFVTMVNNIYGYNFGVENYVDVSKKDWFSDQVQIAKANYMSWLDDDYFYGNRGITREEVCAILYTVMHLEKSDTDRVLSVFEDDFNDWSKDFIGALVKEGYLSGYPDKTFRGTSTVTRAESVVMLNNIMGSLYNKPGVYGGERTLENENVTVSSSNIVLENMYIKGDLIVAAGVGDGEVTLENVTVYGRTIINGGGSRTVTIRNSKLGEVIVYKLGERIRLVNEDSAIDSIVQKSSGQLIGDFSGTTINLMHGDSIVIDGNVERLIIDGEVSVEVTKETKINTLIINQNATITGEGMVVNGYVYAPDVVLDIELVNYFGEVVFEDEEIPLGPITPPIAPPVTPPVTPPENKVPVNTVLPTLSGVFEVGNLISTSNGVFTDETSLTYSYDWEIAENSSGANKVSVGNEMTYLISEPYAGYYLRSNVRATDTGGLSTIASSAWHFIDEVNTPPVNTLAPSISGDLIVDSSLTVIKGKWTDESPLTYRYEWYLANDASYLNPIKVSDDDSYTVLASDSNKFISVVEIASDGLVNASSRSEWFKISEQNNPPVNETLPIVTGLHQNRSQVSTSTGSWIDEYLESLVFKYEWQVVNGDGSDLETVSLENNYLIEDDYISKYLRVKVTAVDEKNASETVFTNWVMINKKANEVPVNDIVPSVEGVFMEGEQLIVNTGTWHDDYTMSLTYEYEWVVSEDGLVDSSTVGYDDHYKLTSSEANKYIRVKVTAIDAENLRTTAETEFAFVSEIENKPPVNQVLPVITGEYSIGEILEVSKGVWVDDHTENLTYSYTWEVADDLNGLNAQTLGYEKTYTLSSNELNRYIRAIVTAIDEGELESDVNTAWVLISNNDLPPVNNEIPTISGLFSENEILLGDVGTWNDEDITSLIYSYQWQIRRNMGATYEVEVVSTEEFYQVIEDPYEKEIRLVIAATDKQNQRTSVETEWHTIDHMQIDYVALGDSISKGYVLPSAIDGGLTHTPYAELFVETLELYHGVDTINMHNLSVEGYDTDDLLVLLSDSNAISLIEDAEVITICIGGNNLMQAAKKTYYIFDIIEVDGYDFTEIDPVLAEQGRLNFEQDFDGIMNTIKNINSTAEIIVMTVYNPFNVVDDTGQHDFTNTVLNNGNNGINDVIRNNVQLGYRVADVYNALYPETLTNNMMAWVYMYDIDYFMNIPTRNPHPKVSGQSLIKSVHDQVYHNIMNE